MIATVAIAAISTRARNALNDKLIYTHRSKRESRRRYGTQKAAVTAAVRLHKSVYDEVAADILKIMHYKPGIPTE